MANSSITDWHVPSPNPSLTYDDLFIRNGQCNLKVDVRLGIFGSIAALMYLSSATLFIMWCMVPNSHSKKWSFPLHHTLLMYSAIFLLYGISITFALTKACYICSIWLYMLTLCMQMCGGIPYMSYSAMGLIDHPGGFDKETITKETMAFLRNSIISLSVLFVLASLGTTLAFSFAWPISNETKQIVTARNELFGIANYALQLLTALQLLILAFILDSVSNAIDRYLKSWSPESFHVEFNEEVGGISIDEADTRKKSLLHAKLVFARVSYMINIITTVTILLNAIVFGLHMFYGELKNPVVYQSLLLVSQLMYYPLVVYLSAHHSPPQRRGGYSGINPHPDDYR